MYTGQALKRDSSREPCLSDCIGGPRDRKTQKFGISDVPPTVNRLQLNTSSTSFDTPEDLRSSRKKMISSTRLSAITPPVDPRAQTGEPVGPRASNLRPPLGELERETGYSSTRTINTASNGLTNEQLQLLLDTIQAGSRTNERLMDQLDTTRDLTTPAEPSSRKFKPEKYGGTADGNSDSWRATMRVHMEQEMELPQVDKIFKVINLLAKDARTFVLNKPPGD